jgi:CheY-like chemotaxis protein
MVEKIKILLVDDESKNIKILLEILSFEEEYVTMSALSGEECLALIPEFQPDIVLLDIMMPGLDGYEVCKRIRNNPEQSSMKIMMLSGRAMQDEIDKGMAAGADQYIAKPFSMTELLDALKELWEMA